jgi:hypothetical protein
MNPMLRIVGRTAMRRRPAVSTKGSPSAAKAIGIGSHRCRSYRFDSCGEAKMKFMRRWLIYRRLVNELADAPAGSLEELGTSHKIIHDFAWQCARAEVERGPPMTRHP